VQYNREGDLLFSCAKSAQPAVWFPENGERLGTFKGHNGAVWSLDLNRLTTRLLTGSADATAKLFDVQTGKEIHSWAHRVIVRWVSLSESESLFLTVSDAVMGHPATIWVYDPRAQNPIREIRNPNQGGKYFQAKWGPFDNNIYATCDDGSVTVYDFETGNQTMQAKHHRKPPVSLSFSEDKTHFITASHDYTAKLYDTKTLENLKTFETERPVNAAALSPINDLVLLAGGQQASQVTTTRQDTAQFRLRFFHKIYQNEIATLVGHFGPVNSVAFAPDGCFASGGEDGYVRVHNLEDTTLLAMTEKEDFDDEEF